MKSIITLIVFIFVFCVSNAHAGAREDWYAVADAVEAAGQAESAADIRAAVGAMTDEELYLGYGDMDLEGAVRAFQDVADAFDAVGDMAVPAVPPAAAPDLLSPGLPGAVGYPTAPFPCPFSPDRSNADDLLIAVDAIEAANIALEIAEGIWSVSDRACTTVAVAIGAVGNPQNAACIAADVLLFAAKAVVNAARATVDHIAFCDGAVDSAEIEGAYERAGHIHSDLEAHDANIDGDLAAHDANIDGDLVAHDANIDGDLIAHDANIDGDLIAHDANIDGDLAQHDADIKELLEDLQGAVDENQRLIKITMARQLEIMRLLITPSGRRSINPDVLNCTGDDCPEYPALQLCPDGSLDWNCGE